MSQFTDSDEQAVRSMSHQDRLDADAEDRYQSAINSACHAIRMTPIECVTNEYIAQVLCALSSRAADANHAELADQLGAMAMEIDQ